MRVLCKRTYIEEYVSLPIKFIKGNYYNVKMPEEHERKLGVYYHIQSENKSWSYIKVKDFQKYFIDIDQLRNDKIDEILNR